MSPPSRVSTCDGEIQVATPSEFLLNNRTKVKNFIWGALEANGELTFWIENLPKDGKGCPGWWMFDQMMAHFGSNVTAIQGHWSYGDNLEAVNTISAKAVAVEIAALSGPTGTYAAKHGFGRVSVISKLGVDGAYSEIHVRFEK